MDSMRYKPAVRTSMMPQPSDQHHPTRQKMTVMACNRPTMMLTRRATRRCSQVTRLEKRGAPQQTANKPLRNVPSHCQHFLACHLSKQSISNIYLLCYTSMMYEYFKYCSFDTIWRLQDKFSSFLWLIISVQSSNHRWYHYELTSCRVIRLETNSCRIS